MGKHKYPLVRIRSAIAAQLVKTPADLPAIVNQALEQYIKGKQMNDQYTEALSREEAQRIAYWECVDEEQEEELEKLEDEPLSAETLQWIYDQV